MSRRRITLGLASLIISTQTATIATPAFAAGQGIPTPKPSVIAADSSLPAQGLFVGEGATPLPPVLVSAWMVADATTGEILAARDPRVQMRPASTLKMLTVLAAAPNLEPAATYVATPEDAAENGSRLPLVPGQTYTIDNLLSGIFLRSGNDAARALAMANGGVEKTMEDMRAEAARLGAVDTTVQNVTGLEEITPQYSTAQDLVLIAREGLQLPVFARYAATRKAMMPGYFDEKADRYIAEPYPIYTDNRLLNNDYPGALGIKDGFTRAAGRTFVGAAERDGHTLIVSMLNIVGAPYGSTKALLDWGFDNIGKAAPIGVLPEPVAPAAWAEPVADPAAVQAAQAVQSEGSGLMGVLKVVGIVVLVLAAIVAGLRARAVIRMRRRAAARAARAAVSASSKQATPRLTALPTSPEYRDGSASRPDVLDGLEEISA